MKPIQPGDNEQEFIFILENYLITNFQFSYSSLVFWLIMGGLVVFFLYVMQISGIIRKSFRLKLTFIKLIFIYLSDITIF